MSAEGGSWDLVFSGPVVAAAEAGPGPAYGRLDGRMNRRLGAVYPLDAWPEEPRPSLERPRRITLPTTSESIQFYRTQRRDVLYDWGWSSWY